MAVPAAPSDVIYVGSDSDSEAVDAVGGGNASADEAGDDLADDAHVTDTVMCKDSLDAAQRLQGKLVKLLEMADKLLEKAKEEEEEEDTPKGAPPPPPSMPFPMPFNIFGGPR